MKKFYNISSIIFFFLCFLQKKSYKEILQGVVVYSMEREVRFSMINLSQKMGIKILGEDIYILLGCLFLHDFFVIEGLFVLGSCLL